MTKRKDIPMSKVFGGRRYHLSYTHEKKHEADKLAKRFRSEGTRARVTREKAGTGEMVYTVWTRG